MEDAAILEPELTGGDDAGPNVKPLDVEHAPITDVKIAATTLPVGALADIHRVLRGPDRIGACDVHLALTVDILPDPGRLGGAQAAAGEHREATPTIPAYEQGPDIHIGQRSHLKGRLPAGVSISTRSADVVPCPMIVRTESSPAQSRKSTVTSMLQGSAD